MTPKPYTSVPVFSLKVVREKSLRYPYPTVGDPDRAAQAMRFYLKDKESEHLAVLMLDGQHNFLGLTTVAVGGIAGMQVALRDVYKAAIIHRAAAIVLGHNHPSGSLYPSSEDITFTHNVVEGGKLLGIPVIDHIIISSGLETDGYYSFNAHGRM